MRKKSFDLALLMEVPKAWEKSTRILWKERASLTEGEPIRRVSSTYYWWVEGGLEGYRFKLGMLP